MNPEFKTKFSAQSLSDFSPREEIPSLIDFFKREKWCGQLQVNFAGNGGVTSIRFIETRKATISTNPEK